MKTEVTMAEMYAVEVTYGIELGRDHGKEYFGPYNTSNEAQQLVQDIDKKCDTCLVVLSKAPILNCEVVPVYCDSQRRMLVHTSLHKAYLAAL
jgi:hypothetical protein